MLSGPIMQTTLPLQAARQAIDALLEAREAVRHQTHLFSFETWRSWRELDQQIAIKLEDVGHRMAEGGELVAETVTARARELRQALDTLLREHAERPVHSIMTKDVETCHPEDTLEMAARSLWENDCGALPVVDAEGHVLAVLTDRDICMAAYTRNLPLKACSVASTMSRSVHACKADDPIQRVASIMAEFQVRRVPVAAPDGKLLGIVAIADLVRYLASLPDEHPARAMLVSTLAAIGERRWKGP